MTKDQIKAPQVELGKSGIKVSRVCFGSEYINTCTPEFGGQLLADAARCHGVFFWDTDAEYGSHPQISAGLRILGRANAVVTSKTYAKTPYEARRDLNRTLIELDTKYLDICLLHRVKANALESLSPAIEELWEAKKEGLILGIGLSTHSPSVVLRAAKMDKIQIICVTLNRLGKHLDEGTKEEMAEALKIAHESGKGTYVIKTLGQGKLVYDLKNSLEWVLKHHESIDAYNIGFANMGELRQDLEIVNDYYAKLETAKIRRH